MSMMRKKAVLGRTTEGFSHFSLFSQTPLFLRLYFESLDLVRISISYGRFRSRESENLPEKPLPGYLEAELTRYFQTGVPNFTWPTSFKTGTAFERTIWKALRRIPAGQTRSYAWLARSVGRPLAARAVGQALGKNPLPIIFPCHRIVRADGGLGGFSSGTRVKKYLLDLERENT